MAVPRRALPSPSCLAPLGLALLLALASTARADAPSAPVNVTEGWRYRWGDSPTGTDGLPTWAKEPGDGGDWHPMKALSEPPGRGAHRFLWLSLPIPAGGWPEPALYLGQVAIAVEVYANGRRIYASGTLSASGYEVSENHSWHLVPLPPEARGGRVLLRLQSSGPTLGVSQAARVGAHRELLTAAIRAGQMPFVVSILLFAVALVSAGTFLVCMRRRMLLALAVFAASGSMTLLGVSGLATALWNAPAVGMLGMSLGMCLLPVGMMTFVAHGILEGRLRWFQRARLGVSTLCVGMAGLCLVAPALFQRVLMSFLPVTLAIMLLCIAVAAVEAWRGNRDARLLGLGVAALVLSIVLTVLSALGKLEGPGHVTHWGFLALTVSLVGIVARRGLEMMRTLSARTRELEDGQQKVRRLAELMGDSAGELSTVVQQLSTTSDEQTAGVSQQAVALQQVEQTVQEIRRTSHLTAEKAAALAASAEGAEQVEREGSAALTRTLADLESIRTEVSEMARRILTLDARTREVSNIVDSVKTLADQSNMLAINAAIEAVRSGDSGKGFGVVAREMRGLADQSIQATHRIREVLDGVSASMRETAHLSGQGEERVRQSVEAVRASGAQLQQLSRLIGETSTSMRQITAAVTQQDAGTTQMVHAIEALSGQMQQTLKTVRETQDATRSVRSLAEGLSGMATEALGARGPASPTPARP